MKSPKTIISLLAIMLITTMVAFISSANKNEALQRDLDRMTQNVANVNYDIQYDKVQDSLPVAQNNALQVKYDELQNSTSPTPSSSKTSRFDSKMHRPSIQSHLPRPTQCPSHQSQRLPIPSSHTETDGYSFTSTSLPDNANIPPTIASRPSSAAPTSTSFCGGAGGQKAIRFKSSTSTLIPGLTTRDT